MQSETKIVPVVLAGGSGTRLWPISRDSLPKQFLSLTHSDTTLYQDTLLRVSKDSMFTSPVVVTNDSFRFFAQRQARKIGVEPQVILEPARRDSAPALLAATFVAQRTYGEDCFILVLAADHIIGDMKLFHDACSKAVAAAAKGNIVTFGITPTEPVTSYGYIQPGPCIEGTGALVVSAFVEKPKLEVAREHVANGFLWNSGNFLFRASVMVEEAERFEPEICAAVRRAVEQSTSDLGFIRLNEQEFSRSPSLSIDYAVMERTDRAAVVEGLFPWSDVGSWSALHDLRTQHGDGGEDGNVVRGPAKLLDTENSFIHSDGPLVTGIGLKGIAVIATDDAILVMPTSRSEEVKQLVGSLKADQRSEALAHSKHYRPWGSYQTLTLAGRFQVKKIVVDPGQRLSLQKHHHRSEHWIVVQGTAEVTIGENVFTIYENQSTYIPLGEVHRLSNPGKIPLELIEVQVGAYLGEDDIVRFEDIYSRV